MFREMRRKNQQLSRELCMDILEKAGCGVLALQGDEGYPYAVPLNHVLAEDRLYFHCAVEGHKIDALRRCDRASYCVIESDDVDAQNLTTRFRSVIVFGRARLVEDKEEKRRALMAIGAKFAPENMDRAAREIDESLSHTGIIELTMEHISGKESRSLARERREREEA